MAAEHLLTQYATVQAAVGEECFGDGGEQGDQVLRVAPLLGVIGKLGQVQLLPDVAGEGTTTFGHGFHAEQHAAHVGVDDDRVGNFIFRHCPAWCTALNAFAGISDGALVRRLGATDALDADGQAFVVHHGEHCREPFVGLADQPTAGAVEVHHAGGRGLDAHLVFDRTTTHRVGLAERTVGVDQYLGHYKQRDASWPCWGVR